MEKAKISKLERQDWLITLGLKLESGIEAVQEFEPSQN